MNKRIFSQTKVLIVFFSFMKESTKAFIVIKDGDLTIMQLLIQYFITFIVIILHCQIAFFNNNFFSRFFKNYYII